MNAPKQERSSHYLTSTALGVLIIGLATLTSVLIPSCGSDSVSAAQYNDNLIKELEQANARMVEFYSDQSWDSSILKELATYYEQKRLRLSELREFDSDPTLRDAAMDILAWYEKLCREENRMIMDLQQHPYLREDSLTILKELAAIVLQENRFNQRFAATQDNFADEHGVILISE